MNKEQLDNIKKRFGEMNSSKQMCYECGMASREDIWNFIQEEIEKAEGEEANRWINQKTNEHDNRIRKEAVMDFIRWHNNTRLKKEALKSSVIENKIQKTTERFSQETLVG